MKKALITGITGQDGSYLAEILIAKGYQVHGVVRRASSFNTQRLEHIYQDPHEKDRKLVLHYGDLSDGNTFRKLLYKVQPDEIYNLGAQSHVRVSFDIPEYTAEITGVGALRVLEAIKDYEEDTKRKVRFYQASSSEMFGSTPPPQNESSPFHPRSPYGCAKVFAYNVTVNYRESYGMYAVNGILFNHETVAAFMPMFCKKTAEQEFDIKPISEIVPFDETLREYQGKEVSGLQVLGKKGWVDVRYASAYPHDVKNDNKRPRFVNARSGGFMATSSHVAFLDDGTEKETGQIAIGDRLEMVGFPEPTNASADISAEEAELIGMIVGDGCISYAKKGTGVHAKFTNSSPAMRSHFSDLWHKVTGGSVNYQASRSGFNPDNIVGQLGLAGGSDWLRSLDIYNFDRTKRIPRKILNGSPELMLAFLRGYNAADGLKANPCTYEFKNFKTNSSTLALGLWYLIDKTTKQDINLTLETREDGRVFYSLNILSPVDNLAKEQRVRELVAANGSQRGIARMTGISRNFIRNIQNGGHAQPLHYLRKDPLEVKKILDMPEYAGWFYDLETSSGEFHCGIGKCHVHNSPRRGETFVTHKITRAVARIKAGLEEKLYLGNLDARRDWGYAPEYMEAAWMMLQQDEPDDYVIGTGESHSVRDFLDAAFNYVSIKDWSDMVGIDPRYYRPAEVENLIADASKAKKKLGWQPQVKFEELVGIMMDADLKDAGIDREGNKI